MPRCLLVLVLTLSLSSGVLAQEPPERPASAEEPSQLLPVLGVTATTLAVTGAVIGLGTRAWWEEGYGDFTLRHAGWFGRDTYSGGADKAGHAFAAYAVLHGVASIYELFGVRPTTATWLAAGFGFVLFNGFEFVDGFTHYGFEYGDAVANVVGLSLGVLTRLSPEVASVFGLRLSYFPSADFVANEKSVLKFINDYTGMLFLADVKGRGVMERLGRDPGWLRYLVGGVAYGTQAYSPVKHPASEHKRMLGLHVGLAVPEVLRALAPQSTAMSRLASVFEFYAVPGLSLLVLNDLNGSGWYVSLGVGERAQLPH